MGVALLRLVNGVDSGMTTPLALLFVLLTPQPQDSNWVLLERTDQYVTYVDSSSLKTVAPGMVELRSKQTFAREQFERQNHYNTALHLLTVDCRKARGRSRETLYYSGTTLIYRAVGKSASLQWIVPQPGWRLEFPWEATIRMACRSTG